MALRILEIGPGVNPCVYAFDSSVQYIGVDPDMHYFVANGFTALMARVREKRGDLSSFTYRCGQLVSDVAEEMDASQDIVVMANVLGDMKSYRGAYSGFFVDPETGATRQTGVRKPRELIAQALSCLKPAGSLVVVEDAVRSNSEADHMPPEEFTHIVNEDARLSTSISSFTVLKGGEYAAKARALLYPDGLEEPTAGYFDTCFVAELQRSDN